MFLGCLQKSGLELVTSMKKKHINKSWVMILRDLRFGGQANFVQVKDNTRLVHGMGAVGMSGM